MATLKCRYRSHTHCHEPALFWVSVRVAHVKLELDEPEGPLQVTVSVPDAVVVTVNVVPGVDALGVPTPANAPKVEHL